MTLTQDSNMAKVISGWMAMLEPAGECPSCGGTLYRPRTLSIETGDTVPGACPSCGYKGVKDRPKPDFNFQANKSRAIGYLRKNSVVGNLGIYNKNFRNFQHAKPGESAALKFASDQALNVAKYDDQHVIFYGPTGVGKSHLAMGMIWRILEMTKYQRLIAYVNFGELLKNLKQGMHDSAKDIQAYGDLVVNELKNADIVVLDDLGSETNDELKGATDYTINIATSLFEAREDKSLIVTTNLSSSVIKALYGDRIFSRLFNNSRGNIINLSNLTDHRLA